MSVRITLLICTALIASIVPARAQNVRGPASDRFFMGGGVGAGWTRIACEYCRREHEFGPIGYLRLGSRLRPGLLIGAELNGWTHSEDEEEIRLFMAALTAVGWLYPNPARPLFLKGGLGWVNYRVNGGGEDDDLASGGPGLVLGAGYEFRLSESLTMTNYINVVASAFGKLRSGETVVVENLGITSIQFGVGVTKF
jgi:hypothetical protein